MSKLLAFLSYCAEAISQWLSAKHDAAERKAGSDATTAATQQATIASVERQNQAAVNAPGVEGTITSLEEGKF